MNEKSSVDKCLSFISAQLESGMQAGRESLSAKPPPSITISRQTGAGGIPIAEDLAAYLRTHGPSTGRPWTVFDKNLVDQVMADHNLPREIARYLPEDRISKIDDMVEELLGLHPPSWTLLRQTAETVMRLAELGNAILVGRGANLITARLENVFHVRLVGSVEKRVKLVEEFYGLESKEALRFLHKEDRGRQRYMKEQFGQEIDNPLLYHLVINTDRVSYQEATWLIGQTVLRKYC
jgi:hypothetical protein